MQSLFPLTVLSLNCQQAYYHDNIKQFLFDLLKRGDIKFLVLQEISADIIAILNDACGESYRAVFCENTSNSIGIVYKNNFELLETASHKFPDKRRIKKKRYDTAKGIFTGLFRDGVTEKRILVASSHLHANVYFKMRLKEMRKTKQMLLKHAKENIPVIFGGDFNTGFFWENRTLEKVMAPEFVNITRSSGPTHFSERGEPYYFITRFGLFLAKFGIKTKMKLDHIFVSSSLHPILSSSCKTLPVHVSDHLPIMVNLGEDLGI